MSARGRLADPVVAGALLVFGACVFYAATRLPGGTGTDPLGPRAFPALIGIGFIGCGLALLVKSLALRTRGSGGQAGPDDVGHADGLGDGPEHEPAQWHRILPAGITIALYTAALPVLGFLLATVTFMVVMILLQGSVRRRTWVTAAVLFPASVYVLFTVMPSARLPPGFFDPVSLLGGMS